MHQNILQLHDSAGLYGGETVILNLSRALKQTKYNSIVGCLTGFHQDKPALGKEAEAKGLDVAYFPMRMKFDPFVLGKIGKVVQQRKVKIIHTHGYKSNLLGLIVAKASNVSIITTNHLFPPMPLEDKKLQFYSKCDIYFTMKYLDKIVAVSEAIKEKLIAKGVNKSKIVVSENGIDIGDYDTPVNFDKTALRKAFNINDNAFVVGTLGRLTPQKGHVFLLEAVKKVLSKNIPVIVIIAGDGFLKNKLMEYSRKLNISDNIIFLGFRNDTINLLKLMDVFVMSSIDEGLPMAMLEAMASRLPVIVTSVGDIPKVIIDNKNGILVEPSNSNMLADKIVYLLNNKSVCREISVNAFNTVCRYHSKEEMCKKYLAIYEKLIIK